MLTQVQLKTYEAIQRFFLRHGHAPTTAELAETLGTQSRGVVYRTLKVLVTHKLIELLPRQRRNIRLCLEGIMNEEYNPGQLPILGRIAAGKPIEAISENAYINVSQLLFGGNNRYLLQVKGDSMIGDRIYDNDLIICEQRHTAHNGEIVVALIKQSEATLKRIYYQKDGTVLLVASNPEISAMVYAAEDVMIQGIYIGLIRINQLLSS